MLGGLYAHSPLRGGRREESSVETPGPVLRSTRRSRRLATPDPPAAVKGKSASSRGAQRAGGAVGQADRIVCAVESQQFFGAGRMKKWRGHSKDADDLLAQLVVHFKLADAAEPAGQSGAGAGHDLILLQFFDKELDEYIDLEASSWQDFMQQVFSSTPAAPSPCCLPVIIGSSRSAAACLSECKTGATRFLKRADAQHMLVSLGQLTAARCRTLSNSESCLVGQVHSKLEATSRGARWTKTPCRRKGPQLWLARCRKPPEPPKGGVMLRRLRAQKNQSR